MKKNSLHSILERASQLPLRVAFHLACLLRFRRPRTVVLDCSEFYSESAERHPQCEGSPPLYKDCVGVPSLHSYSFRAAYMVHFPPVFRRTYQFIIWYAWSDSIWWKDDDSTLFSEKSVILALFEVVNFWVLSRLVITRMALSVLGTVLQAFARVLPHSGSGSSASCIVLISLCLTP